MGDFSATTSGGMDRLPTDRELNGGIIGYGIGNIISAFFGCPPTATFSQNVGIVGTTKVISRRVFATSAGNPSCSRSDSEVFGFIKDDSAMRAWRRGRFGVCFYRNDGNPTACNGKTDCP